MKKVAVTPVESELAVCCIKRAGGVTVAAGEAAMFDEGCATSPLVGAALGRRGAFTGSVGKYM
jgi:hypothetical protein